MNNLLNIVRGKIWGTTKLLFKHCDVEIHRIEVQKNAYCSKHLHNHKYNLFFVENGKLKITIFRTDAGKIIEDCTELAIGQSTIVEPGLYHQFLAIDNTIAFEIYWQSTDIGEDIVRESLGGIKNE